MLDENGQDIGSEQMAELVGDAGNTVQATLTLIFFKCSFVCLKSLSILLYTYWNCMLARWCKSRI
jgi:hypothetical protein